MVMCSMFIELRITDNVHLGVVILILPNFASSLLGVLWSYFLLLRLVVSD